MPTTSELQRVGEVAMSFAKLQFHVDRAISELVAGSDDGVKRRLHALTVEMTFDAKVHAFASLIKLRFPEDTQDERLQRIVAELFDAQRKSEAVLRSDIVVPRPGPRRINAVPKPQRGLRWQHRTLPEQELAAVSAQIAETCRGFDEFVAETMQRQVSRAEGGE